MFVPWIYRLIAYWDAFGYRVVVEQICRHMVPAVIVRRAGKRPGRKEKPRQKQGTYG